MTSTSLQAQLMALLRFDRAQVLEVRAASEGPAPQFTVGQKVEAQVESRAPDNRVLLKVEGALVQAKLPESVSAQVGQRLPLTVLKVEPALTFLIQPHGEAATPPGATKVNVSELAARVSQLLERTGAKTADPATSTAPLLAEPTTDAEALVLPLKSAIDRSGLFYESHQAQWVSGQRTKEALQAEPQAKWVMDKDAASKSSARLHVDRPSEASAPTPKESVNAPTAPASPLISTSSKEDSPTTGSQQVGPMLERQLNTLATQTAVWQGQLWPGQTMLWELEERASQDQTGAEEIAWRSRIKLQLPRLGDVDALLELNGDALSVRIVSSQKNLQLFGAERAPLQSALAARGIELRELDVKSHGEST